MAAPTASLETRNLTGVEILAPGTWNGDPYTSADLDQIVSAFYALQGKVSPPGKLGHDRGQALAQRDGYPAIGWVSKVYRVGQKLVADFEKVPAKVAALIQAGAYNKVSSEIYFDLPMDGTVYPRVLRAVSFLGADSPAVKDIQSISDVAALYGEFAAAAHHYADMDVAELDDDGEELDEDSADLIAQFEKHCAALEASIAGKPGVKRVRTFLGQARKDLAAMRPKKPPFANNSQQETGMDIKVLAEALGLAADADEAAILAAVKDARAPKMSQYTDDDFRRLNDQLGAVTSQLAERTASEAVDAALRAGKIAPAQVEWAKNYALKDADGFKAYAEAAPKLAILSAPIGHDREPGAGDSKELTEAELAIARQMGTPKASLERAKSGVPSAELAREARQTAGVR